MKKILIFAVAVFCFAGLVNAQPRPADKTAPDPATTPESYEVRYEGGVFGASGKEKGTIKFDDANARVVFARPGEKEMFSIPYDALLTVFPDSKDSVPQSGKVIAALPLPGAGLANLMNKSTKYANITFEDPDFDAKGTASFRFDEKEMLLAFVHKLGAKAKMKQRGDAYYKAKSTSIY